MPSIVAISGVGTSLASCKGQHQNHGLSEKIGQNSEKIGQNYLRQVNFCIRRHLTRAPNQVACSGKKVYVGIRYATKPRRLFWVTNEIFSRQKSLRRNLRERRRQWSTQKKTSHTQVFLIIIRFHCFENLLSVTPARRTGRTNSYILRNIFYFKSG